MISAVKTIWAKARPRRCPAWTATRSGRTGQ